MTDSPPQTPFFQANGILLLIASLLVQEFIGPFKIAVYVYICEEMKPFCQLLRYLGNQTGIFETTK